MPAHEPSSASLGEDRDSRESGLIKSLKAKMQVQDQEIARLLAARRIPTALHSGGGSNNARMQSLSQLPSNDLNIGSIEAEIGRTLDALTHAHQRLKVHSFIPSRITFRIGSPFRA